jgi:hypothetical protein
LVEADAETPVVVRGAKAPVKGVQRENRNLPLVVAGAETPVVVQGAKALIDECPEGEPKSPFGRDATAIRCTIP